MWPLAFEATASLLWVCGLVLALVAALLNHVAGRPFSILGFGLAWGIAISVVATLQLAFALVIEHAYDRRAAFAFLLGPLYPLGYWAIAAAAALRSETGAVLSGPAGTRVVWDIERDLADSHAPGRSERSTHGSE